MKQLITNLLGGIKMTPELILALIAFASAAVGNILQFLNNRSLGRKAEIDGSVALVDIALKLNREEFNSVRQFNKDMAEGNQKVTARVTELETKLAESLYKLKDALEENEILKLSLESVQCELDVKNEEVKRLKEIR
jgi:cell shape-determining protein MreC